MLGRVRIGPAEAAEVLQPSMPRDRREEPIMSPPWIPADLFTVKNPMVLGQDAFEAVRAMDGALDLIEMHDNDAMMVFRHPRAIVFLPYTRHAHDQDCNRA
jgi:hypothetical protein